MVGLAAQALLADTIRPYIPTHVLRNNCINMIKVFKYFFVIVSCDKWPNSDRHINRFVTYSKHIFGYAKYLWCEQKPQKVVNNFFVMPHEYICMHLLQRKLFNTMNNKNKTISKAHCAKHFQLFLYYWIWCTSHAMFWNGHMEFIYRSIGNIRIASSWFK